MHQHLTFFVEKRQTLDALEAVLAIARRGGLQLSGLQLNSRDADDAVHLSVQAGEPGLLELFVARLHNVIGIGAIDVNTPAI
jgi:hypothetical protein